MDIIIWFTLCSRINNFHTIKFFWHRECPWASGHFWCQKNLIMFIILTSGITDLSFSSNFKKSDLWCRFYGNCLLSLFSDLWLAIFDVTFVILFFFFLVILLRAINHTHIRWLIYWTKCWMCLFHALVIPLFLSLSLGLSNPWDKTRLKLV